MGYGFCKKYFKETDKYVDFSKITIDIKNNFRDTFGNRINIIFDTKRSISFEPGVVQTFDFTEGLTTQKFLLTTSTSVTVHLL